MTHVHSGAIDSSESSVVFNFDAVEVRGFLPLNCSGVVMLMF